MNIKIFDLPRDHRDIKDDLMRITGEVLDAGDFILGKSVRAFEEDFARYTGSRYGIGVNSGTDAIKIAGLAMGLGKGDKILTTPNTYIATVMSLSLHGIAPVLCDVDLTTYTMDVGAVREILEKDKDIKVCIPVHLYGHPCRIDEIAHICRARGVGVLEDACQAHGARFKGVKVGTFGDASAFSFYPTKNLGCYGDGGILLTDSETVRENALMLRNHGQKTRHAHVTQGYNSRLDELQAAYLRHKLGMLDQWNQQRRTIAGWYRDGLEGLPLVLPVEEPWAYHVYHLFVVRTPRRDELMRFLAERGVTTLVHYPTPIHLQEGYRGLGYREGSFPNAERAAREILTLPLYPSLTPGEVAYVCQNIRRFFSS